MSNSNSDQLFKYPMGKVPSFTFDEEVAKVFPDMIERSVPGYSTVVSISGVLCRQFSKPGTKLYDLGCSLGATSFALAKNAAEGCQIVAVDNSKAMIESLRHIINKLDEVIALQTICADICDIEINNTSFVALNYTLQFVSLDKRQTLINTIFNGMIEGGVLILSEKIAFSESSVDQLFTHLHHQYKSANGYTELEISQKREAIENVLVPERLSKHIERLKQAGFSKVDVWFQCFNFVSIVAIK